MTRSEASKINVPWLEELISRSTHKLKERNLLLEKENQFLRTKLQKIVAVIYEKPPVDAFWVDEAGELTPKLAEALKKI